MEIGKCYKSGSLLLQRATLPGHHCLGGYAPTRGESSSSVLLLFAHFCSLLTLKEPN